MGPSGFRVMLVLMLALGALVVTIGVIARDDALILVGLVCGVIPMVVRLLIAILGPVLAGGRQNPAPLPVAETETYPDHNGPDTHWAEEDGLEQAKMFEDDQQIYLARWGREHKLTGVSAVRRLMTFSNASDDFYRSSAIPNALTTRDNVLVFETAGLVCKAVRDRRNQLGQKVIVLDPFGRSGSASDCFNPLDFLRPEGEGLITDAGMMAELVLVPHLASDLGPQDARVARVLLQGLIIHTYRNGRERDRNLAGVHRNITLPAHRFYPLLGELGDIDATEGRISDIALSLLDMSDERSSAILAVCRKATAVFNVSEIEDISGSTSFELEDITTARASVFVIGDPPDGYDQPLTAWCRVVLGCLLSLITNRDSTRPTPPWLVMLDRIEALGRLVQLERLLGGGTASGGLTLWPCFSGVSAVMEVCHNWENVVGRSDVIQIFGQDGAFDLDWSAGLTAMSRFVDTGSRTGSNDAPVHLRGGDKPPMLKSVEVARMPETEQLLFYKGVPPLRATRLQWEDDDAFRLLATRPPTF
ncbi:type IV secretory system conjugative DNA transfer family protein [Thalassospira mesophila]|uniref:TraD/TraG TraM recognition site domain-containing protein n=1 Tax=Thalassospira mesophila TaxID=1293891 RepID=A0A1Y2L1E3_9PROT|nr:type IV secretory system conjugative DNA transfer family protein [Thalassospira mesophila]OSQ38279.1 hypothetical protein TMES_10330 [Thalassospira mesophila]